MKAVMLKRLTATALALALFSAAPQTAPAASLEEPNNGGLGMRLRGALP